MYASRSSSVNAARRQTVLGPLGWHVGLGLGNAQRCVPRLDQGPTMG
jgi:hypothetical protein